MAINALHIGDLHFWTLSLHPRDYLGKRALGNVNLLLRRARRFHQHLAPKLVERLRALEPDCLLFSGDFTTTSKAREFAAAAHAIQPALAALPRGAYVVPGNHDRYSRADIRRKTFESNLGAFGPFDPWPRMVNLGEGLWLACIDATTSNGLGCFGLIVPHLIAALETWWAENRDQVSELWVLCHFPAEEPPAGLEHDRGIQLRQANLLLDFIKHLEIPVFYLHGHHHYRWAFGSPTVPGLTYLNAGAPLLRRRHPEPDLGFLQLRHSDQQTSVLVHSCPPGGEEWIAEPVKLPGPGEYVSLQAR